MFTRERITSIIAWCLYDWASSAYSTIITTFIFATYFITTVAKNEVIGTYQWATATGIAGVIVALSSPLVGAIADHGGHHKRWLSFFTLIAVICTGLLWFAYPNESAVHLTLFLFVMSTIAFEVAQVFYNAFLPSLAPKNYLGRISGWGWGCGYIGGIFALCIVLIFFVKATPTWLNPQWAEQIRICGPFVALWYGLFSLPLLLWVPNLSTRAKPLLNAIRLGCNELFTTLKVLPQQKNILLYLVSHMIYIDGLNTLFAFGGVYAAGTFKLSFEEVLLFGITMNITAGIGAISLAWLDDYVGSKITILVSLVFLIIFGIPLLFLHQKYFFWAVALCLCIFVGPVQAASRSLMARLIAHHDRTAEMFGLYAMSGRITSFIGPWLLGLMTLHFGNQRAGMATVLFFFVIGGILLLPVNVKPEIIPHQAKIG